MPHQGAGAEKSQSPNFRSREPHSESGLTLIASAHECTTLPGLGRGLLPAAHLRFT